MKNNVELDHRNERSSGGRDEPEPGDERVAEVISFSAVLSICLIETKVPEQQYHRGNAKGLRLFTLMVLLPPELAEPIVVVTSVNLNTSLDLTLILFRYLLSGFYSKWLLNFQTIQTLFIRSKKF